MRQAKRQLCTLVSLCKEWHSCCVVDCSKRQGKFLIPHDSQSYWPVTKLAKSASICQLPGYFLKVNGIIIYSHVSTQIIGSLGERTLDLAAWLKCINRKDWTPGPGAQVCSAHLISGKPAQLFDENSPDWAPTVNIGWSEEWWLQPLLSYKKEEALW